MMMSLTDIKKQFNININGVIHIGAHYGQEYQEYYNNGIRNMIFFEPIKSNFQHLISTLSNADGNIKSHNIALGNFTGLKVMNIETANKGQSCSILKPELHLKKYPTIVFNGKEIVSMDKLDNIAFDRKQFNMINIDVQGYELEVFKGSVSTLRTVDIVYAEVNTEELYKDCVLVGELDEFLGRYDFKRVLTKMTKQGWGDALYLKN